ncbi:hypothetical protein [Rhodopirellula sp. SWK7]|uniref:hypothetical protein n=1 Tax=Rhodopirellula sp. SWK7 TaxID=595460 RepID=UPI00034AAFB1|nr:hypothetical protein [Rhodopirellula sp. SWK7]
MPRLLTIVVVLCLVIWRGVWLTSGVENTCSTADFAAAEARRMLGVGASSNANAAPERSPRPSSVGWRISFAAAQDGVAMPFALRQSGTDVWDDELPVWITPGKDGQPGWATWDDNGDGTVDEPGELGAAWSDDFCIVQLPGQTPPEGRIIDHGGFRPVDTETTTATSDAQRDLPSDSVRRVRLDVSP